MGDLYAKLKNQGMAVEEIAISCPEFDESLVSYKTGEDTTNVITCPITICNIQEFSGATTDDSAISFELRFDGAPEVAPGE